MQLNPLNIRKGLELEVPVKEIFSNPTEPEGDINAMFIHNDGWENHSHKYQNLDELFKEGEEGITYYSEKEIFNISDSLVAYVYDCYLVYENEDIQGKIESQKNKEIEFVNTKILNYYDFCHNTMLAQEFTGKYERGDFKYPFIGVGDFEIKDCIESCNLLSHSNVHLLNFFIFYKKIFTSIGFLTSGLYKNDIKQQKEYFNKKEYNSLLKEANRRSKIVEDYIRNMQTESDENFEED